MSRSGVFLNLERSAQRRAAMEDTLRACGLGWVARQPAADGATRALPPGCTLRAGEYGCFLSHLQAIEGAPPDDFRFVFEDDVECSPQLDAFTQPARLAAVASLDLLLLDCQPDCNSHVLAQLWTSLERQLEDPPSMLAGRAPRRIRGVELADAGKVFRWGLQAYVVTPRGRPRVLQVLREGLAHGPVRPVDLLVGDALRSGRLHAAVAVPFLATPRLASHADSTIGTTDDTDLQALASAARRLLFAGPTDGLHAFTDTLLARTRATSPDQELLGRLMGELTVLESRVGELKIARKPQ